MHNGASLRVLVSVLRQGTTDQHRQAPSDSGFGSLDPNQDTIQEPPDRVFLIAHFSAWRSPRATRIALSGLHRLAGTTGTKPLAD